MAEQEILGVQTIILISGNIYLKNFSVSLLYKQKILLHFTDEPGRENPFAFR